MLNLENQMQSEGSFGVGFSNNAKKGGAGGIIVLLLVGGLVFNTFFGGCEGFLGIGGRNGNGIGGFFNGLLGKTSDTKAVSENGNLLPNLYTPSEVTNQGNQVNGSGFKFLCDRANALSSHILSAAQEISSPEFVISPQLLAGMLRQESHFGINLTPVFGRSGDCNGTGDSGHGWGIGQLDNRQPEYTIGGVYGGDIKEEVTLGGKTFKPLDCKDGIRLMAYFLKEKSKNNRTIMEKNMKDNGLSLDKNANGGFTNIASTRAFTTLTILSYNGFKNSCKIESDGSFKSSNCEYPESVINFARLFAKCIGQLDSEQSFFEPTFTRSENTRLSTRKVECIVDKNGRLVNPAKKKGNWGDKLDQFIKEYKNKNEGCEVYDFGGYIPCGVHDSNGFSYGQCVSLSKRWQKYIEANIGIWPNRGNDYPVYAFELFNKGENLAFAPPSTNLKITSITKFEDLQPGDVVAMSVPNRQDSHTGILVESNESTFKIFQQNPGLPNISKAYPKSQFKGAARYEKTN
jgi:hypothetical protein